MSSAQLSADRTTTISTPYSSDPVTPEKAYGGHDGFFSISAAGKQAAVSQRTIAPAILPQITTIQIPTASSSSESADIFTTPQAFSRQATPGVSHSLQVQSPQPATGFNQPPTDRMRDLLFGNSPASLERMYALAEKSSTKTSLRPLMNFLGASAGKLVLGVGAGHLVEGILLDDQTDRNIGIALITLGFSAAVAAAWSFAGDVKKVHNAYGWLLKIGSISAASTIGAGYALHSYGKVKKDVLASRLSFVLLAVGPMLLSYTLPRFVSYSEIVNGQIRFPKQLPREACREICGAAAYGLLFGLAITIDARWPPGFSQTFVSLTAILFVCSIALAKSDHIHEQLRRLHPETTLTDAAVLLGTHVQPA